MVMPPAAATCWFRAHPHSSRAPGHRVAWGAAALQEPNRLRLYLSSSTVSSRWHHSVAYRSCRHGSAPAFAARDMSLQDLCPHLHILVLAFDLKAKQFRLRIAVSHLRERLFFRLEGPCIALRQSSGGVHQLDLSIRGLVDQSAQGIEDLSVSLPPASSAGASPGSTSSRPHWPTASQWLRGGS